jgi:DNA-binding transcriptional MocR family regulator
VTVASLPTPADFGGAPSSARLAFSYASPDEIRVGIGRLAALIEQPVPA